MSVSTWAIGIKSGGTDVVMPVSRSVTSTSGPPSDSASISYQSDGNLASVGDTTSPAIESDEWKRKQGSGEGTGFEIRATKVSGADPTSGALNTWQALSTSRTWQLNVAVTTSSELDIEIRKVGTTKILGTTRVTLTVVITP